MELTTEERRALDDFLALPKPQRDALLDLAEWAAKSPKDDDSVSNLEHLKDVIRRRPRLIQIFRNAERWEDLRRYFVLFGGAIAMVSGMVAGVKSLFAEIWTR